MPTLILDGHEMVIIRSNKIEDIITQIKIILRERKEVNEIKIIEVAKCYQ